MNGNAELRGKYFQVLKRRGIDSSFDQAEEVYGDTKQLREFLLAHISRRTYRPKAIAEFFAETRQINLHPSVDSRLQAALAPPNEITGSFWGNSPIAQQVCGKAVRRKAKTRRQERLSLRRPGTL
jgi:hypothetical protein